ncbi:MAG: extracellular solute-binding protein [Cyanobacteria bacterium]|nr:extracellular solute-binding protein [Cyanobacteriota bacterium]MDW8200896.1 extracellular solute-binding protein [Cyanobacteriota bacterium SKYGB_h_bin112]
MGITRRSLVMGAGMLATSSLLAGCATDPGSTVHVRILKGSIPVQMVKRFRDRYSMTSQGSSSVLVVKPESTLSDLFALLQALKSQKMQPSQGRRLPFLPQQQPSPLVDLVTMGDYWLATAIRQGLIQPLQPSAWSQWEKLPNRWRELVTRDNQGKPSSDGQVWAAPYGWGTTVIAYRADRFGQEGWLPPQDWADLWRPELQGWISLPDNAREVIGLALKRLGQSYNTADLTAVNDLEAQLVALNRQAKLYSSSNYLEPLILGDTAVAVGWSTDILPLLRTDRAAHGPDKRLYGAVIPASGTALWANLWVRPADSQLNSITQDILNQWIDFCWESGVAPQLSLLSGTTSPIIPELDITSLPTSLTTEPLLSPAAEILDHSEPLLPLTDVTIEQYRQLWRRIRQPVAA